MLAIATKVLCYSSPSNAAWNNSYISSLICMFTDLGCPWLGDHVDFCCSLSRWGSALSNFALTMHHFPVTSRLYRDQSEQVLSWLGSGAAYTCKCISSFYWPSACWGGH